jgi:hypothetical protein
MSDRLALSNAIEDAGIERAKAERSPSELTTTKTDDPAGAPVAPEPQEKRRRVTMQLRQDAWKQVKIAAVERGTTAHDLMVEALNDWFTKHGKPPIA